MENKDTQSFADGLKDFFSVGSLVTPIRLNNRMKSILLEMIEESRSKTSTLFEDDDEYGLNLYLSALQYISNKIDKSSLTKIKLNKLIAGRMCFWVHDHRYYHLAGQKDFEDAMQWVTNLWNKHYSKSELFK